MYSATIYLVERYPLNDDVKKSRTSVLFNKALQ